MSRTQQALLLAAVLVACVGHVSAVFTYICNSPPAFPPPDAIIVSYDFGVTIVTTTTPWTQLPGDCALDAVVKWINQPMAPVLDTTAAGAATPAPWANLQWNMRQIRAVEAAPSGAFGTGARVAVLDVGMVQNHEALSGNIIVALGKSFVPGTTTADFVGTGFSHATHVAGIVAASAGHLRGVAPAAQIVPVKVLDELNSGSGAFSWVISGIDYASGPDVRAQVINLSLGLVFDRNNAGGGNGTGLLLAALNKAVAGATRRGCLVVAAAGNAGVDLNGRLMSIPAQSSTAMAVSSLGPVGWGKFGDAALTPDRLASYTNYGRSVISVAASGGDFVYAPDTEVCTVPRGDGGTITGPCWIFDLVLSPGGPNNAYYFAAGTSMSAPHVSGVAALLVGKYGAGALTPAQLRARIENSAAQVLTPAVVGKGRLDAVAALA